MKYYPNISVDLTSYYVAVSRYQEILDRIGVNKTDLNTRVRDFEAHLERASFSVPQNKEDVGTISAKSELSPYDSMVNRNSDIISLDQKRIYTF